MPPRSAETAQAIDRAAEHPPYTGVPDPAGAEHA